MKCQILFSRENMKMFAETKFIIQQFEIFFLLFPENKKHCFFGGFFWAGGGEYQLVIACGISPESEKG